MIEKQYKNIKEVSRLLDIKEHIIRYWDSIDPKTNKIRFHGLSTRRIKGGTSYFNMENIERLEALKNLIYENGKHNNSLALASKILSSKNKQTLKSIEYNIKPVIKNSENLDTDIKKLNKILLNLKELIKT